MFKTWPVTAGEAEDELGLEPDADDEGEGEGQAWGNQHHQPRPLLFREDIDDEGAGEGQAWGNQHHQPRPLLFYTVQTLSYFVCKQKKI